MKIMLHKPNIKSPLQLHLALGGGGARALAHIGVLKVIEGQELPIGRLSGTSGGAGRASCPAPQQTLVMHRFDRLHSP